MFIGSTRASPIDYKLFKVLTSLHKLKSLYLITYYNLVMQFCRKQHIYLFLYVFTLYV